MFDVEEDEGGCDDVADLPGARLTLRRALNVVFSKEFPRSPMARTLLWALLKVFWMPDSSPSLGFLYATVMVSASPS